MTTETKEQDTNKEEQVAEVKGEVEEEATGSKDDSEQVLKDGEDDKGGDEKTYSEKEHQTILGEKAESLANSIAAKSTKTMQKALQEATAEIKEMKKEAETDKAIRDLAQQEGKELTEWGDTTEVREFQKTRRDFTKWMGDARTAYQEVKDRETDVAEATIRNNALMLAIKYKIDKGDEIVKGLEEFIKEITEDSKTVADMELKALKISMRPAKNEGKTKTTTIDTSRKSAPGGIDFNKLSPSEQLVEGFKQLNKTK